MKLIDLLVQELPKRGGWPKTEGDIQMIRGLFRATWSIPRHAGVMNYLAFSLDSHECVSREQYEAALAVSQQTEWNGEGLPPVGAECELVNFFGNDFPDFIGEPEEVVKIIGNGFANGCPVAFYEADGGRGRVLAYAVAQCFRPIRTEAERKREETIDIIANLCHRGDPGDDAAAIYEAIASGKIPGISLE